MLQCVLDTHRHFFKDSAAADDIIVRFCHSHTYYVKEAMIGFLR